MPGLIRALPVYDMKETSSRQFGLLVAYVLPGFIGLAALAPLLPAVARWLRPVEQGDLGLGPPLYAVLMATAVGLILSCFRWLLIDRIHQWTGVRRPAWNDRNLERMLGGFDYLVQSHFRYYEFCGNTLLATIGGYTLNRVLGTLPLLGPATDLAVFILCLVLFAASRDALAKYYTRTSLLVGRIAEKEFAMFNGNDHGGGHDTSTRPQPASQPQPAPPTPVPPRPVGDKAGQDRK